MGKPRTSKQAKDKTLSSLKTAVAAALVSLGFLVVVLLGFLRGELWCLGFFLVVVVVVSFCFVFPF